MDFALPASHALKSSSGAPLTCSSAKRLAFSVWFISSSWFDGLADRQIRHALTAGSADPSSVKRTLRDGLGQEAFMYLSIDRSLDHTYIGLQNVPVKFYLWIDRVRVDRTWETTAANSHAGRSRSCQ